MVGLVGMVREHGGSFFFFLLPRFRRMPSVRLKLGARVSSLAHRGAYNRFV